MKQTTKTLLTVGGLAVVALGVAFAAAWAGKDEETKATAKEQSAKVINIDLPSARDLKLVKAGRLVGEMNRKDDKTPWAIIAPVRAEADEAAVNGLVTALTTLRQKSQVDGVDLKQVGLADESKARLVLTLTGADGKAETIALGDDNPFDQTVYVHKSGEAGLRLIARSDRAPLENELVDLRDKRVFHVEEAAGLSKLIVVPRGTTLGSPTGDLTGKVAFEVDRDGTSWKLAKPVAMLADGSAIDRMIASLKGLRAKDVSADSNEQAVLTQHGLGDPAFTVTATVNGLDGKTFERKLLVGQTLPLGMAVAMKYYAKRDDSPAIFEIDGSIFHDLGRELFELEDKSLLTIPRESVAKIELASPGQPPLIIARTKPALPDGGVGDEVFTLTAPRTGPARKYKTAGLLSSFTQLKAVAPGEPKPADAKGLAKLGLDSARTVTLFDEGGARLAKVHLGAESADKKHVYVWVEGRPDVAQIDQSIISDVPKSADEALEPPAPASTTPPPPPMPDKR